MNQINQVQCVYSYCVFCLVERATTRHSGRRGYWQNAQTVRYLNFWNWNQSHQEDLEKEEQPYYKLSIKIIT